MNDLELLIEKSLTKGARQRLKIYGPDHIEQLLEDMRGVARMAEAMNWICQHHPIVFEEAYNEVLKNDNR
tara:strand:+ start:864 stop:1073 length:210 start_codon:yes stop_codon:yes gene_type:complete